VKGARGDFWRFFGGARIPLVRRLRAQHDGHVKTLWQLNVVIAKANTEAFCDWVRAEWAIEPVAMERPHGDHAVVNMYFDSRSVAHARQRAAAGFDGLISAHVLPCHEKEWTTFWRHHFRVLDIGRRLRIVPIWEKAPDRKRLNLKIDPGLSFGTGDHFTTRFCLEALEAACDAIRPKSMLDAGTGSGILAIAAAKLGVPRIAAFDNDPVCVKQSRKNAILNRLGAKRIRFFEADVLAHGWETPAADIVCANILTPILIQAAPALWRDTRRQLMLTGIRETEGDSVAQAFHELGAREILRDGDGEWCGLVFARRN